MFSEYVETLQDRPAARNGLQSLSDLQRLGWSRHAQLWFGHVEV